MEHLEILAAAAVGRLIPRTNLNPFISLAGLASVIFGNQLELEPALSHVLRGISRSLAQLHSAPPVFAALHAETGLFYTHAI